MISKSSIYKSFKGINLRYFRRDRYVKAFGKKFLPPYEKCVEVEGIMIYCRDPKLN